MSTIGIAELKRLSKANRGGVYSLPPGAEEWHAMPHDYYSPGAMLVGNSHGVAVARLPRDGGLRVYWATPEAGRVLSAEPPEGLQPDDVTVEIAARAVHEMLDFHDRKYSTGYFWSR